MNTLLQVYEAVRSGLRPVVTFKAPGASGLDGYPEPNIRARIVGGSQSNDEVVRLTFEFDEFSAHNQSVETANYRDRNTGEYCLTARQADRYKPVVTYVFGSDQLVSENFDIADDASLQLMTEYKTQAADGSYVHWLEQQLLALRKA